MQSASCAGGIATMEATLAALNSGNIQLSAAMKELEKQKTSGNHHPERDLGPDDCVEATLTQALTQIDAGLRPD